MLFASFDVELIFAKSASTNKSASKNFSKVAQTEVGSFVYLFNITILYGNPTENNMESIAKSCVSTIYMVLLINNLLVEQPITIAIYPMHAFDAMKNYLLIALFTYTIDKIQSMIIKSFNNVINIFQINRTIIIFIIFNLK